MLLSDIAVVQRLFRRDEGRLVVEPLVNLEAQLGPSSLDVHLGHDFRVMRHQEYTHLDPFLSRQELERQVRRYTNLVALEADPATGGFVLHPGEFTLSSTLEFVALPRDIAARIEGRSSWGRLGLQVHSTAGFIDPGFQGTITFELSNVGQLPIPLFPGLRIGQLAFFGLDAAAMSLYGDERKYHQQIGTQPSRFYDDPEVASLRDRIDAQRLLTDAQRLKDPDVRTKLLQRGLDVRDVPTERVRDFVPSA